MESFMILTRLFCLSYIFIIYSSVDSVAAHLSVNDIVNNKEALSPKRLVQLSWVKDSHRFSFIDEKQALIIADAAGHRTQVLSLERLSELTKVEHQTFPTFSWVNSSQFWFIDNHRLFTYDIDTGELREANVLQNGAANMAVFSPTMVAYTVGENIFLSLGHQCRQITFSPSSDVLYGTAVHRQEFGITAGIFWSPQGDRLAYYRMDQSMVDDYHFLDFRSLPVKIDTIKYPMAGRASHHVSIEVYNVESKETVTLKTGLPADQYLTGVTFSSDGKSILVNILNREQNRLIANRYDAASGELIEQNFELNTDKYIDPHFGFYFSIKDEAHALWCSRHEGWSKLFRYNLKNKSLTPAKRASGDIASCLGFLGSRGHFFYTAFDENYPSRHGYLYDLAKDEVIPLTKRNPGMHHILPSSDGTLILDEFSNNNTPYQVDLIDSQGGYVSTIHTSLSPLQDHQVGPIKMVTLKSADGKYDLYGRILYPKDLDPQRKYPAIVYVYGGPGVQIVQDTWLFGARLWELMMAQKGYVVFALDNRGSANRGLQFEQETFSQLGALELADQMMGVKYLKSLPFVDQNNLGVFGWSYGGFMATSIMLREPDAIKAGVAGGAVTNWADYEIMYTERYMKKPNENAPGYDGANLLNYVSNLKGALFVISGTHDDVVVPRHTKLLIDKAIEHGKDIDIFFYPYGAHHFDKKSDVHMYTKISKFFDDHLRK